MTIFKKMLFVPVLSLIFYISFITYSFFEQQRSSQKIQEIRDDYVPILDIVNDNIHLFEQLRDSFKDAVLAHESIWLNDTLTIKERIEENLTTLEKFPEIVEQSQLIKIKKDLNQYFLNATNFAQKLILKQGEWIVDDSLIQNIDSYLNLTEQNLARNKQAVQIRFIKTIDETNQMQSQLLFWGGIISIISVLFIIIVALSVSISTRRSMQIIVNRTKELVQGDTDFSRRIQYSNKDEVSYMVYWFNKLSDKLEEDYIKLKEISITDKLTQLNNRVRTEQFIPSALLSAQQESKPLALVIIDIDHFKAVNDTYGHLAGDSVLQSFALALKNNAFETDYISRWGGEEFLLVWQNTDVVMAYQKAEQLRAIIADLNIPVVGRVTASFGIACFKDGDDNESLIARADDCLYQAKALGRNKVVTDPLISF